METIKKTVRGNKKGHQQEGPRSLAIARNGIQTGHDFAALMSSLMSDVIEGSISPGVANAAVNAGGKLLKAVELQMKYGQPTEQGQRLLRLVPLGEKVAIQGAVGS